MQYFRICKFFRLEGSYDKFVRSQLLIQVSFRVFLGQVRCYFGSSIYIIDMKRSSIFIDDAVLKWASKIVFRVTYLIQHRCVVYNLGKILCNYNKGDVFPFRRHI